MEGQPTTESYADLGDRELLRRFAKDADEQAFAEIVKRYERLVNAVCRRVIGSGAEVDDAFQATFLTLARRPRQIRKVQSLSSWLYSVAWRISVRLVRAKRRHPVQPLPEEQTGPAPDPLQQIADDQDAVILDEELQTLPNKYRDVLVMTYFADQTSQQIADQLDVSKGTIDGRIRQGRNMLRVRLARRGVGIGALAAAAHLLASETVSASPTLVSSTIEVGTQTLSQSLPGTTDLSNLEPLVRPEITSMISVKAIISSVVGVVALAGLAGMAGGGQSVSTNAGSAAALQTANDGAAVESADDPDLPGSPVAVSLAQTTTEPESVEVGYGAGAAQAASDSGSKSRVEPFTIYPEGARPTEKWLYETLEKPIPEMDFKKGTPLPEILAFFVDHYSDTEKNEIMQIWEDSLALEELQIESLDKVLIARDIKLRNVALESALRLVLATLDGVDEPLTVIIKDEVLMLTTAAAADDEENYTIRSYNVAGLIGLPIDSYRQAASPGGGAGGGLFSVASNHPQLGGRGPQEPMIQGNLVSVVMAMTRPPALWQEHDGEGGTIALVGENLVVRQNATVHREIVKLLNLLLKDKK